MNENDDNDGVNSIKRLKVTGLLTCIVFTIGFFVIETSSLINFFSKAFGVLTILTLPLSCIYDNDETIFPKETVSYLEIALWFALLSLAFNIV